MIRNFINIADFSAAQLDLMLDRAIADKALFKQGKLPASLAGKTLAMIFEKPSLRTRVSFEAAMTHLGGHGIYLTNADIGLGQREAIQDIARVLGRMCDGIMARTFSHEHVTQLGEHAGVPVVNALTDHSHPCQAMADLMTVREHKGELAGLTLAFVGDGNNVARSLAVACGKLGMRFILAAPQGYQLGDDFAAQLKDAAPGARYDVTDDPDAAVAEADVVYTDTWVSMGQEQEKQQRIETFRPFQLNDDLMARSRPGAIVLHCLPAYREMEITDSVFEANARYILDEAENRLHFQRSLLNLLMGEGGIA
jgi:ornithine carbamoyltransferase